jgi:hypothetical protein
MSDELNPGQPAPNPPPQQVPPPQQSVPPQVQYQQPAYQQPQNDAFQTLIPTKNPPALISYYVGVASLICIFSPILSPISIYFGIKAMNLIKEQPGLPGKGHAITGFILSGLSLLVFLVIVVAIVISARAQPG